MGWFTFGTFLILKGAFLNSVYEQKQSGGSYGYGRTFGRSLTQDLGVGNGPEEIYFKLPYIEEWTVSVMTHDMGNFHSTDSRICCFPCKRMMCHMFFSCMPVPQGLKLVFPVDNSLQGCYKQRESCVSRDFQGEVGFNCAFICVRFIILFLFSARPLAEQLF